MDIQLLFLAIVCAMIAWLLTLLAVSNFLPEKWPLWRNVLLAFPGGVGTFILVIFIGSMF
ncbi:MAG: hypothetical protein PHW95_03615 [Patescibacteria group bacterium]|nr:hypothetical protein [Patescibacteria group bacterium]